MRARILIALALVGALAGCQESGFDESRETARPLKVQHALDPLTGTRVPGQAVRPLTLTLDALGDTLALGVRPVAAPGACTPVPPAARPRGVEIVADVRPRAIEATEPDVILGAKEFQGDEYDELRKIAPTVMSEGYDWILNLRLHGEALGRTNDAEKLLIDWDNRVAKVKEAIGGRGRCRSWCRLERNTASSTGPGSFARSILAELGIKRGSGGDEVLRVTAGREWVGGGLLGARAVLADIERAL